MPPPKASATVRISANFGPASQFADSPATFIEIKGGTDLEQGEIYLQLSLASLRELADLLETDRLSESEKATYNRAYSAGKFQYDQAVKLRNQLQMQKKSFRKFIVNLFVRESDAKHFRKVTYRAYKGIKRTSEDLVRHLLPKKDDTLALGSQGGSTHGQASICKESPRDVVEVTDLPPNETIRGLNVDVHTAQEEQEVIVTLGRIAKAREADIEEEANENEEADEDEDNEDDRSTIRPSSSRCAINIYINQSVVSFDSESTGTTLNVGGVESALHTAEY